MAFANNIKSNIRNLRNWTWELTTGAPIDLVSGTADYTIATDLKNTKAVKWISLKDSSGNKVYYSSVDEMTFLDDVQHGIIDPIYYVSGNDDVTGLLFMSPTPTENVIDGIE